MLGLILSRASEFFGSRMHLVACKPVQAKLCRAVGLEYTKIYETWRSLDAVCKTGLIQREACWVRDRATILSLHLGAMSRCQNSVSFFPAHSAKLACANLRPMREYTCCSSIQKVKGWTLELVPLFSWFMGLDTPLDAACCHGPDCHVHCTASQWSSAFAAALVALTVTD